MRQKIYVEKISTLFERYVENSVESVENSVESVERYIDSILYLGINVLFISKNSIICVFSMLKNQNVENMKNYFSMWKHVIIVD